MPDPNDIMPGIHPTFRMNIYPPDQQKVIRNISKELFITRSGDPIKIAGSTYNFFLVRPTTKYVELFNLRRELVVILSNYPNFEPRNLEPFQAAAALFPELRIDNICFVIVSKDSSVETKISEILKNDTDKPIVIPFSYAELEATVTIDSVANKFRKYLYERDLFNFESPLRNDSYFFGRSELVHNIIGRHERNENSGLFGLRKTGKTSIIYKIQRLIERKNMISTYIDCQSPTVYMQSWNTLLYTVIVSLNSRSIIKINKSDYDNPQSAAAAFERDIDNIFRKNRTKKILIIFDEVEHIFPHTSAGDAWRNGADFVHFFRTLRSIFQTRKNIFSYLIVSTNPSCVEQEKINGFDNPLFMQIPFEYVPPFSRIDVESMLSNLGGVMGITFSDQVCSSLTEDFGGHPFLIRLVASQICKETQQTRPITIDPVIYQKAKRNFSNVSDNYFSMMLDVLDKFYNEEYEMIKFLANENIAEFKNMAFDYPMLTEHLIGYKIIGNSNNNYYFLIEEIKNYILRQHRYEKKNLTLEQKLAEISQRRNALEPRLRMIVRQTLMIALGSNARDAVIKKLPDSKKCSSLGYDDLFDPRKCQIYLKTLGDIIKANWSSFKNIFDNDDQKFNISISIINEFRSDAHAKKITDDEFNFLRLQFSRLEEQCMKFLGESSK